MRRAFLAATLAAALLPGAATRVQAGSKLEGGSVAIARHNARSGGTLLASAGHLLHNTVGEVGVSSSSGGAFRFLPGLANLSAQPGSVTAITAVTKDTDTLQLAWTAPGADGPLGTVTGGFYRVDYSSDPSHAFAPTTFQLEVATTVVPGSAQALTLTGLQPNTTYYTRIYLADARKYFAEDSRRSDESTYAKVPVDPTFSAVFATSATISWTIPSFGSEGYNLAASTTNFGTLFPGGIVTTSETANGLQVNLTLQGLTPATTYFFKVASLNWQSEKNFAAVIATVTGPSLGPLPIQNLAVFPDPLGRRVLLTWTNPSFADPDGVVVVLSTSPSTSEVLDGTAYAAGTVLADAGVVRATGTAVNFADAGLTLDTTVFYHLFSRQNTPAPAYSISVSTVVFLDLPPMSPAGLALARPSQAQALLSWQAVTTNDDGSGFQTSTAPRAVELAHYEIQRSTSLLSPSWVQVATLPLTSLTYLDTLPDPNATCLYRVRGIDSFKTADAGLAVASDQSMYVFAKDGVTQLRIPKALTGELQAGGNGLGANLIVRAVDLPANASEKVFRSVRFETRKSPSNELVRYQFSQPDLEVLMHYDTAGGQVVPNAFGVPSAVGAPDAAKGLGIFWDNGAKFIKLFGTVDPVAQTAKVKTALGGTFQLRELARDQAFTFDISQLSNKAITPNGDGLNDRAVFVFDNPRASSFSGEVFDVRGGRISDMAPGPLPDTLQWDGKANGRAVPGGVYVYQIRSEGKVFHGTLVVIR